MRVIHLQQATDLQALTKRLIGNQPGSAITIEQLKALNPHVDFNQLAAGTVLLVPDTPGSQFDDKDIHAIGEDAFEDLARHLEEGFKLISTRIARAADALTADRAAMTSAAKSKPVKALLDQDPQFKEQLQETDKTLNTDLEQARQAAEQVQTMWKDTSKELAALRQLLH